MPALLTGLGWLALSLVLFLFVQRWLHLEIHAVFLILTRHNGLALGLFSLVFFPGVLLHELSHYLMARLLRVRTGRLSLLPRVMANGQVRLGYVETARTDVLRDALIGTAPLIAGGLLVAYLGVAVFALPPIFEMLSQGSWQPAWQALAHIPNRPDFALWFYLAFTISSTMLPSTSDWRAWPPLVIGLGVLLVVALIAGAGNWMLENLAPGLLSVFNALTMVFAISLVLHLLLGVPIWLLRMLLSKVTGLRVVNAG